MTVFVHHHHRHPEGRDGDQSRAATYVKALITLIVVTAIIAAGAGLAAYAVSKVLVSLMS
jgi:hypothetical protein